jgi:glycosyltransferase involved in cell wall biosynthesis
MNVSPRTDVLVVSVAGTIGWGHSASELTGALQRAGAQVISVVAPAPREVRTYMFTDLLQASAARKVTLLALAEHRPDTVIYCSMTAALLWPRPGVVWLDATAAENRPGRHGLWQRPLERRRLRAAPLVLGCSPTAVDGGRDLLSTDPIVVPIPVEPSGPIDGPRDVDAVTYAADPDKRRLALVLAAWRAARREGETLVVTGRERPDEPGVRYAGRLATEEFRGLLRRARVFIAAPREEEYGIAALEALADGAQLVTTPVAVGAYPALALARRLDPRLVAGPPDGDGDGDGGAAALAAAVRAALDSPRPGYAERAAEMLAPYRRDAVTDVLRRDVLPVLLPGWRG